MQQFCFEHCNHEPSKELLYRQPCHWSGWTSASQANVSIKGPIVQLNLPLAWMNTCVPGQCDLIVPSSRYNFDNLSSSLFDRGAALLQVGLVDKSPAFGPIACK